MNEDHGIKYLCNTTIFEKILIHEVLEMIISTHLFSPWWRCQLIKMSNINKMYSWEQLYSYGTSLISPSYVVIELINIHLLVAW